MARHDEPSLSTAHFTFAWYDEAGPDAHANLLAVATTAESDLVQLGHMFDLTFDHSWGPVEVLVNSTEWGASNYGYRNGPLGMYSVTRAHRPAHLVDEAMRAFFVAELSEILMDYRTRLIAGSAPWNARDSAGEGLSRVCSNELHHEGFLFNTPRTTWGWIDYGSPDYVTTSYPSDLELTSMACAFLFLYYLHSQLMQTWTQIITASGTTLQDKYAALGFPGSGYGEMCALLRQFFGDLASIPDPPDNPFPLLVDARRRVSLSVTVDAFMVPGDPSHDTVVVSPGGLCPAASYDRDIYAMLAVAHVRASIEGFAVPTFQWTVEGASVAATLGPADYVSVHAPVESTDPSAPSPPTPIAVDIGVSYDGPDPTSRSGLALTNVPEDIGTIELTVAVTVEETHVAGARASATIHVALPTSRVVWSDQYNHDRAQCQAALTHLLRRTKAYRIPPYLTDYRPDPDPGVRVIGDLVLALRQAAREIRKVDPKEADAVIAGLASAHGLPVEVLQ